MPPGARLVRVTTMVDSLQAGGAERVAVELACGLDRTRFAPHVLVTRGDGPLRGLLQDAQVPHSFLERRGRLHLAPWLRARHHLRSHADILHAHKFGSNAWGALLSRSTGVPLVAHEHNFSEQPSRVRELLSRRWIAPAAGRVLCVSDSVADVERANGVPDHLLEVVPNGVRLDAAWPRERARAELGIGVGDTAFVVGIVARLRPEKAHEVLLEAVAQLVRSGRDIVLCVVGDGPRAAELRALATRLGIAERVLWSGERRDAASLAAAFDAGVVCSHWEGLPLAALETMAAGVPLVASSVGGLPTLLDRGAGALVPPADPEALALALGALVDRPAVAAAMAQAGRARIAERYSFDAMVRRVEQVYDEVLDARRAGTTTTGRGAGAPRDRNEEAA